MLATVQLFLQCVYSIFRRRDCLTQSFVSKDVFITSLDRG